MQRSFVRYILICFLLFLSLCLPACSQTPLMTPYGIGKVDTRLDDAIAEFNRRASLDPVGKTQPPLTKEEVLASIRGWYVEDHPGSDIFLQRFKKIADTQIIPQGCYLAFINGWEPYNGYKYKVWWVDLMVQSEKPGERVKGILGYNYRLRAQMISSEPVSPTPAPPQ